MTVCYEGDRFRKFIESWIFRMDIKSRVVKVTVGSGINQSLGLVAGSHH